MATVVVNIDGDASGAVAATGQASGALSSLAGSAATVDKAFTSFERTGSGIRATTAAVSEMAPAFTEAAGGSAQLGGAMSGLGTGMLVAATTANPLAAALIGITAVAANLDPIMEAMGLGAAKVAPPMSDAARATQDASMVFGQFGNGAGVARGSVDNLAGGLLTYAASAGSGGAGAQELANALLETASASDMAAESHHVVGSALQYLEMSQQSALGGMSAMVGGLAEVSSMAQAAGASYADFAATIGTQIVSPAPPSFEARASGGPVSAGRPYIVGENGPELFMPSSSGAIAPAGSFGASSGGGGSTVLNFSPVVNIGTVYGAEDLKRQVLDFVREASLHGLLRDYVEVH